MSGTPTIASIYEAHERDLGLRWLAGRAHAGSPIYSSSAEAEGPAFVGYMSLVRPHLVQVLGTAECEHLAAQDAPTLQSTIDRLLDLSPACIIVADGVDCPAALAASARSRETPLLWAAGGAGRVVTDMQHFLSERLARRHSMHGVMLEVLGVGVLLTGKPGVGKSELALELVSRSHRLVADDAPDLRRVAPDTIEGSCPPELQDFMEVRGLGILNVRGLFGDSSVKQHCPLRLIIHIEAMDDGAISPEQRLTGIRRSCDVLGVAIPEVTLPVAPGHNLAVLVECTVRNHLLLAKGYDAVSDFMDRQQKAIQADTDAVGNDSGREARHVLRAAGE